MATIEVEPSPSGSGFQIPPGNSSSLLTLQAQGNGMLRPPTHNDPAVYQLNTENVDFEERYVVPYNHGGGKTRGPQPELPLCWQRSARTPSPSIDHNMSDGNMSETGSESIIHPDESLMQEEFNEMEPKLASYYQNSIESEGDHRGDDSGLTKDAIDSLEQEYAKVLDLKLAFFNFKCEENNGHDACLFTNDPSMVPIWFYCQPVSVLKEFFQFLANIKTAEAVQMKSESEVLIRLAEKLRLVNTFRLVEETLQPYHDRYEADLSERARTDISAALSLQLYNTERPYEPDRSLPIEKRALVQRYQKLYCSPMGEREFMTRLQRQLSQDEAEFIFFQLRGYHYDPACTGGIRPDPINLEFDNLKHDIDQLRQSELYYPDLESTYRPGLYSYDPELNVVRHVVLESNNQESNNSMSTTSESGSPLLKIPVPVKRGRGRPRKLPLTDSGNAPFNSRVSKKPKIPRDTITVITPTECQNGRSSSASNRTPIDSRDPRNLRTPAHAQRPVRSLVSPESRVLPKSRTPSTPRARGNPQASVNFNADVNNPDTLATSRAPPQNANSITQIQIPDPIRRRFSPSPSPAFSEETVEDDFSLLGRE